jgi:ubiquitin-conjugating enzyme E2 G1
VQLAEASRNMSNLIVNRGTSNSNTFDPFAKQQQNSRITPYTVNILKKQFIAIENSQLIASVGLANDSILEWNVCFEGPSKSLYEGGIFQSKLYFPNDFPNSPPVMKFITPMWHPNIFIDGRVCISILHPPGHDQFNESELESEKWRPILTAEDVLISVISML